MDNCADPHGENEADHFNSRFQPIWERVSSSEFESIEAMLLWICSGLLLAHASRLSNNYHFFTPINSVRNIQTWVRLLVNIIVVVESFLCVLATIIAFETVFRQKARSLKIGYWIARFDGEENHQACIVFHAAVFQVSERERERERERSPSSPSRRSGDTHRNRQRSWEDCGVFDRFISLVRSTPAQPTDRSLLDPYVFRNVWIQWNEMLALWCLF